MICLLSDTDNTTVVGCIKQIKEHIEDLQSKGQGTKGLEIGKMQYVY